jgi:CheY-like chemotaxis protein
MVIEDDQDDCELIAQALQELGIANPVRFFNRAKDALYYLMDTKDQPLLILSDINIPGMDGLELKRKINESHYLHKKSIPFVFLTTSQLEEHVIKAFDLMADGYFVKADSFDGLKSDIARAIDYWVHSRHPNNLSGKIRTKTGTR